MSQIQKVTAQEVIEGAGARVYRLMPVAGLRNFDPFVLMDHFVLGAGMGFPKHPHRGFEGITYLVSGTMRHKDNLGNDAQITAGGAQRFTAGSGIEHSEMPSEHEITEGIQLWINLPKKLKQIAPSWQQFNKQEIATEKLQKGVCCRTLVGSEGGLAIHQPCSYKVYELAEGSHLTVDNLAGNQQIVYLLSGCLHYGRQKLQARQALLVRQKNRLSFNAAENSILVVISGKPIGEPVYQHGPYVD